MNIAYSVISIALLYFVAFFLFDRYRVDSLRQRLFDVRASLFLEAANGKIAFDSDAYRYTRTVLNGMLRFAHRLSLSRIFAIAVFVPRNETQGASEREKDFLSGCPAQDRTVARQYLHQANMLFIRHLLTSPFAWALLLPVVCWLLIHVAHRNLVLWASRKTKRIQRRVDAVAYEIGSYEPPKHFTAVSVLP